MPSCNRAAALAASLVLAATGSSCSAKPLHVGIVFENGWTLGKETLTERERSVVRNTAVQTLRNAYGGFGVQFVEGRAAERLIKVEDTPFVRGPVLYLGAVGATYPTATVSSVRIDALYYAELAAARCQGITGCSTKTPRTIAGGLGYRCRRDRGARTRAPGGASFFARFTLRRLL